VRILGREMDEKSLCFQYSIGSEPYIQYGCIITNKDTIEMNEWQSYIQKSLQHFFNEKHLLKPNEYMDIELYDTNVIVYPYRIDCISSVNSLGGDYNLYIDVPNHYYVFNGHKYNM